SSLSATTTSGNITLAGNNAVGTFAANDSDASGSITFHDTTALTIGAVADDPNGLGGATGATTSDGDILLSADGDLTVPRAINAGSGANGGIILLRAVGDITQSGNGTITGSALGATTGSGNITLELNNSVDTFAASDPVGGSVAFNDTTAVEIG